MLSQLVQQGLFYTARPVSTARPFAPKIAQTIGVIRPIYPRMDNIDQEAHIHLSIVWRPKGNYLDHVSKDSGSFMLKKGNPEILLQDHAVVDSGCSSHMTGNKAYLSDYEDYNAVFELLEVIPKEMKEDEQVLHDELEKMIAQEVVAKALDDVKRQSFEEEKRNITSQNRSAQTTSINKLSTGRSSVSIATTPYVSAASTPTGANGGESSFVYLFFGDKYLLMHLLSLMLIYQLIQICLIWKIFRCNIQVMAYSNGDYMKRMWNIVYLNNMDDTIKCQSYSHTKFIRIHLKDQILGDPKSAVQIKDRIKRLLQHNNLEAIRLFLAFASYMGFTVYQMDVKSAFLYGTIEEEVYVHQPPSFVDPAHPNKVYKVIKALYGLHQAPRAWYETLSSFLMENGFRRGTIDKTLFIKKKKSDIMLVQVYVDDIIFGSTKKSMCTDQDKYVADILKKFDFWSIRTATTPIESNKPLVKDEDGEDVDVHVYRSMIGSLMYLTASRPDIMFAVCACARFQVTPKASHSNAVKRIFRYLKHQPKLGLWYPRDSPFELEAFSDSDYGGASLDRKSTTGGCQFLGRRLISWQCKNRLYMGKFYY
ncbi:putative ribonuclease H-like domain-containing protein [Tanacetum coccineum]